MAENELFGSIKKMDEEGVKYGRRSFIVLVGAALAGVGGWRYYSSLPEKYHRLKVSFITPNREFYKMSINMFYEPKVDTEKWRLELKGPDKRSANMSLDEIKALPNRVIHYTYSCISNPVGGAIISNAAWRVASLAEVLKPVLPEKLEGLRVLASSMDGYYSSVPIELALDEASYIAYEMNGEPLPYDHGFPARIIIPGRYGMKQPKWLKSIEITERNVLGYWEERFWSDSTDIKAMSRIDRAENIESKGEDITVMGVAFAGLPSVGRVEVSVDGGNTWNEARLDSTPEKNVWTLWSYLWKRPAPGRYTIVCRVIDETGKRQIETPADIFPSGATGLHKVTLTVV
jgi:DMSO/TMAO reductase YedYZ molybdopterin-dependent catalytic subunit